MRSSLPPLNCLLAFEAVARRLSFTTAGAELHLTASAISHQIARLEEFLGVRLFERNARNVELTRAGADYLQRVGVALATLGAATDSARKGVRSTLHVHSTPSFASLWLMPRLVGFAKAWPGIALSLSASAQHSDFTAALIDIDIRYGVPNWPQLKVEAVFDEQITPLASPDFLRRHRIATPEQLLQVPLIQSMVSVVQWVDWFGERGSDRVPAGFAYRFDRAFMALDAAVQGLGVALESTSIAAAHLREKRLRPVFRDASFAVAVQAHFLVCPARHAQRPEVAHFLEWIRREARKA